MRYFVFIGIFFWVGYLVAQPTRELTLRFVPTYEEIPFSLTNAAYAAEEETSLQIETLRFYISGITFYHGEELVFTEENSFHLVDAEIMESLQLSFSIPSEMVFNEIRFNLGIDSLTNNAGALGGDLDPTKGMYWTWQSGYINFKLEGLAEDCPARKHRFQFHLGGYQSPFNTLQNLALPLADTNAIKIKVAIDQFLAPIDWTTDYQVMSPNQKAMEMSRRAATIFSVIE